DRARRDDDHTGGVRLGLAVASHHDLAHLASRRAGLQALDVCAGDQADIGMLERRVDAHHLRVGLGLQQARKAVTGVAADAAALLWVLLIENDADRHVEWAVADACEVVDELLDARLVAERRVRVRRARWRLGGIAAAFAVYVIEVLGFAVV